MVYEKSELKALPIVLLYIILESMNKVSIYKNKIDNFQKIDTPFT